MFFLTLFQDGTLCMATVTFPSDLMSKLLKNKNKNSK